MLVLLENKPVIGTTEETLHLDLCYPSRNPVYSVQDSFAVSVKAGEEMRPDILSANFFMDTEHYDMILKRNGVSNPFSINEGDVFFSPDLHDLSSNNAPSGRQVQSAESMRSQYINPEKKTLYDTRLSLVDAQRLEVMKAKADKADNKGSLLPPNIANAGDREIVVKGGKIYFGKDVVKGVEECSEPISKSEFLARLIKTKM